ncbi:glycosyltransferase family protein [Sporomusa malonica]|uniref:Glycosyl transferases group 1 n=1 Tax=Sporomusa malonica TaxID=112901 RepID=A0A1W2ENL0_9FIRM|nr:glycosyltransferase [Sporomusa malonica]SMD10866.1 Glycosyl transferases group 1 [Sporomusa malonica]
MSEDSTQDHIRNSIRIVQPTFTPLNSCLNKPLLITCGRGFNQDFLSAAALMRVGFARGWAQVCGPAKLVPYIDIAKEIDNWDNPAVFMSEFEFQDLSTADIRKLRDVDLFIWVGIHPRKYSEWERRVLANYAELEVSLQAYSKIMLAEPKFVWNAIGKDGFEWYQGWTDDGLRWETIYPGYDEARYFPDPNVDKFGKIAMAYVGGYWPEKAQGFDLYLRPWETMLVPFGYQKWPYKHYGGMIDEVSERQLYSTAGIIPLVTGPAGWLIAEITERYLKAPACGAFCIADHNSALREVFAEEEMLQASSPEHFQHLIREFLADKIDRNYWSQQSYLAVKQRHSYAHRALQIKKALEETTAES